MPNIDVPDPEPIRNSTLALRRETDSLAVVDGVSYQLMATEILRPVKALQEEVKKTFAEPKRLAHLAHKSIVAAEERHLWPLQEIERIAKAKMRDYDTLQQKRADEERRKREEEARRQAEEERLAEAEALEAAGMQREAEAALDLPIEVAPVYVEKEVPKVEGVSYRTVWRAEVEDMAALVAHVAENPALISLLQPNGPALNQMARAMKGAMAIPGVRAVMEKVVGASA